MILFEHFSSKLFRSEILTSEIFVFQCEKLWYLWYLNRIFLLALWKMMGTMKSYQLVHMNPSVFCKGPMLRVTITQFEKFRDGSFKYFFVLTQNLRCIWIYRTQFLKYKYPRFYILGKTVPDGGTCTSNLDSEPKII